MGRDRRQKTADGRLQTADCRLALGLISMCALTAAQHRCLSSSPPLTPSCYHHRCVCQTVRHDASSLTAGGGCGRDGAPAKSLANWPQKEIALSAIGQSERSANLISPLNEAIFSQLQLQPQPKPDSDCELATASGYVSTSAVDSLTEQFFNYPSSLTKRRSVELTLINLCTTRAEKGVRYQIIK